MRTHTLLSSLILGVVLLVSPERVAAQACDRTAKVASAAAAIAQIQTLESAGCLGSTACDSAICQQTNKLLEEKTPKDRAQVAAALRAVLDQGKTAAQTSDNGKTLLTRMGLALAQFVENGRTAAAVWTMEDLVIFVDEPYEIDINMWLESCQDGTSCTAISGQAQQVIELATLFRRILTKANEPIRNAFAAQLELLDKQWRLYLGASRGQYPWELALNGVLYRKTAQFDAPPTSQWIFAHPGAAYEITRNATDRQPSESLLLELAGVYRWTWEEESMKQRWGGSVTMAWRDAGDDRRKLGYGVLAYLPRASTVGYVWRPQDGRDEHSLVLSADLVKFLRGTDGIKERLIGAAKSAVGRAARKVGQSPLRK